MKKSNTAPKTYFGKVRGNKKRPSTLKRALLLFASLVVVTAIAVLAFDGYGTEYGIYGYDYYSYGYTSDAPHEYYYQCPPPRHI